MSEEYKARGSGILPQVSSTVTRTRNSGHHGLPSVETTEDRERMYLISAVKYRPHHPHAHSCAGLQNFLAGGISVGDRPSEDGYRPPLQTPPADRPPGNEPFCGAFFSPLVIAVGAVSISHRLYPIAYLRPACILLPGNTPMVCEDLPQGPKGWPTECRGCAPSPADQQPKGSGSPRLGSPCRLRSPCVRRAQR